MKQQWAVASAEECYSRLGPNAILSAEGYCNATWDTILCWGAAKSNTTVYLPCPALNGLDPNKFAYRHCGPEGLWQGKEAGDYSRPVGYTFYGGCYTKEAYELYTKYLNLKLIKDIAGTGRTLELVGLSVSLVSTLLSLAIFCYFRGLKCHRTRIHKNLFVAIVVQITMRIILCVDQYIARKTGGEVAGASSGSSSALYDKAVFCEILYALLEYTKTVKFMWMFVEGLYLHNMIAVSVFSGKPNYIVFYSLGWGFPVLLLVAWIVPMTQLHKVKCWFAYYYNPLIWILEGPRGAVMAINLAFLLNIIRVLVMKLRESRTNEAKRVRKAVKAAIVLLPLLGLTNFAIMLEPVGDDHVHLSVWMFSTLFLTDLEGFFISLIYCFLNGEVRAALSRQLETWRQHRFINSSSLRRLSRSLSAFTSFSEVSNTAQNQRNSQVASESKSVVNGVQKEFNGRVPSLRFYNRRFSMRRSYSLSACNSSLQVTEPLRAGQLQEQEI